MSRGNIKSDGASKSLLFLLSRNVLFVLPQSWGRETYGARILGKLKRSPYHCRGPCCWMIDSLQHATGLSLRMHQGLRKVQYWCRRYPVLRKSLDPILSGLTNPEDALYSVFCNPMELENLSLTFFRNFPSLSLAFSPHLNLILGENGAGKTNLLEAIFFCAPASLSTPTRRGRT